MHVTNFKSDLTPKSDIVIGGVKAHHGLKGASKTRGPDSDYQRRNHGIAVHTLHLEHTSF